MEKKVKRGEINISIGTKSPTKSPLKESSFPDAEELAMKYGVVEKAEPSQQISSPRGSQAAHRAELEMLRKLEEKNKKIDHLCVLLEALEPAPGVDPERIQKLLDEGVNDNVDFRDAKIVSLAKKSHRLTMQLNKEKTVTDKLNQQVLELQKSIGSLNQELQAAKASAGKMDTAKVYNRNTQNGTELSTAEDYTATISSLNRDIKENNKHIDELKRKLAMATEENKQLSRALTREVGEGVTLEHAVSGGWRGRAQQIIMLKNKIKRLESGEGQRSASAGTLTGSPAAGSGASAVAALVDVDRKAEEDLAAMSHDRRQIVEALTEERAGLMEANQQLERRSTAQKARIHNLEADTRKLKDSLQMVLDKSATDDQLLDALRGEISRLKAQVQQQSQQQHLGTSVGGAGRSMADGITTKYSSAGHSMSKDGRTMGADRRSRLEGASGAEAPGAGVLADSLDFLQMQQLQQQEQWEAEARQLQGELQRLRRLCKNQADQLETQDGTIRQLKKKLNTDFQS